MSEDSVKGFVLPGVYIMLALPKIDIDWDLTLSKYNLENLGNKEITWEELLHGLRNVRLSNPFAE